MVDEKNSATLQVKGLARTVTDGLVINMFRTYGPILRVKVDGFGGAHVVFERKSNAYKAIPATNGAVLEGKPIAVSMVPSFGHAKKTCRGFVAGICKKGSACKYLHINVDNSEGATSQPASIPKVKTTTAPAVSASAPEASTEAVIPAELQDLPANLVCRHFARSHCALGASCKFAHIRGRNTPATRAPAPEKVETPVAAAAPVSKKRAAPTPATFAAAPAITKRPCSYFASGLCKRGEQCLFSHDLAAPAPAKKEKKAKTTTAPVTMKAPAHATAVVTVAVQQEEDSSRTCIECETPEIAVWQCAKCDDSLYCEPCNTLVHKSKVMKSHERTKLPPLAPKVEIKNPTCDECEEEESSVKCDQCDVVLCTNCDASVHKFKSLRSHTRNAIVKPTATPAAKATPVVVVTKPAVAAVVVQEPAVKKQKVTKTKAVVSPVAAPVAASAPVVPEIEYIESVPKYDLTSASESESESESEAEEQQQEQEQEDEDETMDSDDDDEPPVIVNAFPPQSVTNVASKLQQKVAPVPVVVAQVPPQQTQDGDISSESSDDDDERPVVLAAPVRKAPAKPVATTTTTANPHKVPSESESSSDDEPTPRSVPVVAAPKSAAAPAAESSSSSEEEASSSDEEEEEVSKPVMKAPVAKKAPAARAPAPKANPNPGISTGSSHSLVKKIEAYAEADETETLHLDANLNGFERLLAHDCAERLGLKHVSVGEGLERHITISHR